MYIIIFMEGLAAEEFWVFMEYQLIISWKPPARMGMRIKPMQAREKVKPFTASQGLAARLNQPSTLWQKSGATSGRIFTRLIWP